jgi:hypothetical protein
VPLPDLKIISEKFLYLEIISNCDLIRFECFSHPLPDKVSSKPICELASIRYDSGGE